MVFLELSLRHRDIMNLRAHMVECLIWGDFNGKVAVWAVNHAHICEVWVVADMF